MRGGEGGSGPRQDVEPVRMEKRTNLVAFWLLGLFNNSIYVIMLAGAKGMMMMMMVDR